MILLIFNFLLAAIARRADLNSFHAQVPTQTIRGLMGNFIQTNEQKSISQRRTAIVIVLIYLDIIPLSGDIGGKQTMRPTKITYY